MRRHPFWKKLTRLNERKQDKEKKKISEKEMKWDRDTLKQILGETRRREGGERRGPKLIQSKK